MGGYCSQCFPGPLVLGLTLARHFGLIMPKGVCLEMASMPGRPLTASAGEADDGTMLSPGLEFCDFPVAIPRPGFLNKLEQTHVTLRLLFPDTIVTGWECVGDGRWKVGSSGLQVAGQSEEWAKIAVG